MSGPDEEDVATRVVSRDEADKLRSDRVTPQGQAADGLDVTMDDSPRAIRSSFAKALDQRPPKILEDQDRAPMTGGSPDELATGDMPPEPSWMDVSDDHTVSEDSATKDQRPARIEVINAPRKLDRTTPVTARPLESGNRSSRRDDSTGTPFGPYRLLGVVGLGGMAEVRLASRTSPSGARELCVIKRILAEHSDRDDYMDMFTEEARLGRLLEHDNVVQMLDSGMIDGLTYIALELVDGTTASRLAEANPRNCVPVHVVAEIGIQVSKALAYEVASRGITVNAVAPGFIETAMTEKLNDDQRAGILGNVPAGRMGSPEEIAAGVLYLASAEAGYVTGSTLHVNGGLAMV